MLFHFPAYPNQMIDRLASISCNYKTMASPITTNRSCYPENWYEHIYQTQCYGYRTSHILVNRNDLMTIRSNKKIYLNLIRHKFQPHNKLSVCVRIKYGQQLVSLTPFHVKLKFWESFNSAFYRWPTIELVPFVGKDFTIPIFLLNRNAKDVLTKRIKRNVTSISKLTK